MQVPRRSYRSIVVVTAYVPISLLSPLLQLFLDFLHLHFLTLRIYIIIFMYFVHHGICLFIRYSFSFTSVEESTLFARKLEWLRYYNDVGTWNLKRNLSVPVPVPLFLSVRLCEK